MTRDPIIERLCVIGVGLIGGSLALALRQANAVGEIVGYGRGAANLQRALDLGVIDEAAATLKQAVAGSDMIVLAVPVGSMPEVLHELARHVSDTAVMTDVGSVKAAVNQAAQSQLGAKLPRFIPGHPVAGTEFSGVEAAFAELYQQRHVILTPEAQSDAAALDRVQAMWQACGADVVSMSAAEHDRLMAACSHMPHVLAYCLVDTLVRRDDHRAIFDFAAGGFRDFTRIASSNPEMWRDICLANRVALVQALRHYHGELQTLIKAIEHADAQALLETFERAKHARDTYID